WCDALGERRAVFGLGSAALFGRPIRRRHLEAGPLKTGSNRGADERPIAEALRGLPGLRRHDCLGPLAGGEIRPERDRPDRFVFDDREPQWGPCVPVPTLGGVDPMPM